MTDARSQSESHESREAEDIFAREQAALDDAAAILNRSDAAPEELRAGLKQMRRQYERLLQLSRRLTEMSDTSHRELMEITDFKNHLMGMAAHDIRTPVGIMMGFSQILLEDDSFSEDQLKYLEKIRKQGEGLLALLDDLLTLSQTESGSLTLNPENFDLSALLRDAIQTNRLVADKKNIALRFSEDAASAAEKLGAYFGDAARLSQVFQNLIGNAIKYSPPNTEVHATLATNPESDRALVSVADQGLGIPEADLSKIFRPFHRTTNRPTGGEKSTGLGLSIVKRIVEAHDGEIRVSSVVGEGSRFTVELPLRSAAKPAN